jgi:cytochrome b subunit of formate dehydrogenase
VREISLADRMTHWHLSLTLLPTVVEGLQFPFPYH